MSEIRQKSVGITQLNQSEDWLALVAVIWHNKAGCMYILKKFHVKFTLDCPLDWESTYLHKQECA